MRLSRADRERWQAIRRDMLEASRRFAVGMRPLVAEMNRAAAMIVDATWPLRYEDDICKPEEDVFI